MLRDYQATAVETVINWFRYKSKPVIVQIPTGGGKTHVIAAIVDHFKHQRVCVVAHRKELIAQNSSKLHISHGIYAANMGRHDLESDILVASIQSIYNKDTAPFDVIIIDECHRVQNGDDGQYWAFINKHPGAKIIGLTATPYRLKGGALDWGEIAYSVNYQTLLENKYLAPITNKVKATPNLEKIKITAGDYNLEQLSSYMEDPSLIEVGAKNIIAYGADRKSIIIFCVSVNHSLLIKDTLLSNGLEAETISGDTPQDQREEILNRFKRGELKHLINCEILLEGFDAPNIDMIVCLRPTKSKGLWEQMLGRGVRLFEGKENCLLIDMGGNLVEHGALGFPNFEKSKKEIKKSKGRICPTCEEFCPPTAKSCSCGYVFEIIDPKKANHLDYADTQTDTTFKPLEKYSVKHVKYSQHYSVKKKTYSLKVTYNCVGDIYRVFDEYLSPHHDNDWVRNKVAQFFKKRGHELGSDSRSYSWDDLLWHTAHLKQPSHIMVDMNKKYPEIVGYEWQTDRESDSERVGEVAKDPLEGDFIQF